MKRILILINKLSEHPSADEQDVLDQANLVEETLNSMGYQTLRYFMSLNLGDAKQFIRKSKASIVFNLVESIDNKAELIHLPPSLLHSMHIPFTGSGPVAMYTTSNKVLAKRLMLSDAIPTPDWFAATDRWNSDPGKLYIAKPQFEDASVGIDDNSVFGGDMPEKIVEYGLKYGDKFFIEEFVDGREFNVSVIAGKHGPVVLPPAEIIFSDYPAGKPHIVGYEAKWKEDSFEYKNTVRTFTINRKDRALVGSIKDITKKVWSIFGLNGYARVDFRVDREGNPLVLEINANPCISPDSGFYAAVNEAGLTFEKALKMIINDCVK